jgi:6-phosphogluconate dehydrogenase
VPVWSATLAWFDAFRSARLPQNLTQAQRDYFGGHGYRLLATPAGPPTYADWTRVTTEAGESP